ncbi:MAG: BamA/TamA family outer membrane protein [bacterium]|nr:BamA/TamA family outer membrane protein [bacterium]
MKKVLIITGLLLIALALQAGAQETYFGKNKVRYKDFEWSYIQTRHFDIHFYEDAYPTAKFTAEVMEAAYEEITEELRYKIQRRVPVFVYNSHNDFQQTNIISSLLPEGVGGFTEAFKNRIAIPFDGSYEDMRHVLHHELTHAVVYDMLFGNSFSSLLSRQRLFNLPLWFAEGYAEYSSRHGWDYFSDMFVRDATINGYLAPPLYLGGFLAYKQGQAMVKYIADKYGEEKLGEILKKGKIHLTMNKALEAALNINEEDFFKEFHKEMKRRYWPSIRDLKEADEIGEQLTHARKDGSYFNEKPVYSPDGDKLAIFTDKSDFTEIVLISSADGKVLDRLVKSARSGDLESLHSYVSGVSFSPDGKNLVFVAKSKGKEALFFMDVHKKNIYLKRRFDYYNIVSPAWSPDGKKVAFSALDSHKRDLWIYDIETDAVAQVTDDRYDDLEPSWLPNSSELVFSSDRPHPQNPVLDQGGHPYLNSDEAFMPGGFEYGLYNIFRLDLDSKWIDPVDVGPGQNKSPRVSPDGDKIAFLSNRNGIDNIYIGCLDSVKHFAVTNILTGVRSISWSPDGDKLAFSAFSKGAFDVLLLKDLVPVGDNGVLAPTDFVLGEYNLLGESEDELLTEDTEVEESDTDDANVVLASAEGADEEAVAVSDEEPVEATDVVEESADSTTLSDADGSTVEDDLEVVAAEEKDAVEEPAEVGEADDEDGEEAVVETGVYDDEYIYVSDVEESALDSILIDVESDTVFAMESLSEPASFDSIPPLLPSGEYEISKYRVKFTPDFVGGGFSYDTFFGMRGQSYFIFSDYLGNHQILLATDLVSTLDQSFIQAYYFNNKKRTNLGVGLFHTKNFYEDSNNRLFSDRFYGLQGYVRRPFSTFGRLEMTVGQFFIDRKYYDIDDLRENRNSKVSTLSGAYVFDNVLWGYTGPVNGTRAKLTVDAGINLFDTDDLRFYSVGTDYRKYWHFGRVFSMAFRVSGGASFSRTPKQYFLGGTTNWIGSRTLDATVYEVENLYFADVVTPLRGQKYYGISGDRYALINWEFKFPMIQYLHMRYPLPLVLSNVSGSIFTDMGAAWFGDNFKGGTSDGGKKRLQDIKTGFGLGMRINLGIFLLRYDLAWGTDFYKVSDKPTSYFSFGADF